MYPFAYETGGSSANRPERRESLVFKYLVILEDVRLSPGLSMSPSPSADGARTNGTHGGGLPEFHVAPVLVSALSTMATILVTALVGVRFATFPSPASKEGPLLDPRTLKRLAKASVMCFLPTLIFTNLVKNMNASALSELWLMPAIAILHNCIGGVAGWVLLSLFSSRCVSPAWRIPGFFRNPFLVGTMFGNSSQLPLVIGFAFCAQRPLSLLGFDHAWTRYSAGNFIYLIGWNLLFWSLGNTILSSFSSNLEDVSARDLELVESKNGNGVDSLAVKPVLAGSAMASTRKPRGVLVCSALKRLLNMPNLATVMGIALGLVPGARQFIFSEGGGLQFAGSAIELLAQPAVALSTIIVAGNLGREAWIILNSRREHLKEAESPPGRESADVGSAKPEGAVLGFRPAVVFAVSRVIIVGSLNFLATALILRSSGTAKAIGVPEKMVLLVECFTPSANLVVVVSQQFGNSRGAAALSVGYLIQYALFFPMLLLCSTLSVWIIS